MLPRSNSFLNMPKEVAPGENTMTGAVSSFAELSSSVLSVRKSFSRLSNGSCLSTDEKASVSAVFPLFIRAEGLIPRPLGRKRGIKPDCNTL